MRRFRLRYRSSDFDLPIGDFLLGRSSECNLALDDALVSRKHAVLRVSGQGVQVEDLTSRNGVMVNGTRIAAATELRHGDRITLGGEELLFAELGVARDQRPTGQLRYCPSCQAPTFDDGATCTNCGKPMSLPDETIEVRAMPVPRVHDDDVPTSQQTALALLTGIANKALAMGRTDEAERLLAGPLTDLLRAAKATKTVDDATLGDATQYALRLAELTGRARWIDWVFELHTTTQRLLPAKSVDSLYELVRKTKYGGGPTLRAYLTAMREKAKNLSAAERFVLQRLEGLERLVGA